MRPHTKEEIEQIYKALPQVLKDALSSDDIIQTLFKIAKTNNLHIDQAGVLGDMVHLIIHGLHPAGELPSLLEHLADIEPELAQKISREVNNEVFEKIRDELKVASGLDQEVSREQYKPEDILKAIADEDNSPSFAAKLRAHKEQANTEPEVSAQIHNPIPTPITIPTAKPNSASIQSKQQGTPQALEQKEVTKPATKPAFDDKLQRNTSAPQEVRTIEHENTNPKVRMIPEDAKQRIANDPYKEPID